MTTSSRSHRGVISRCRSAELTELLPAAEPVGRDGRVGISRPDGRQDRVLADGEGHLVVLAGLEPEGTGHATAATIVGGHVEPGRSQEPGLGVRRQHRRLVAVVLDQRRAR